MARNVAGPESRWARRGFAKCLWSPSHKNPSGSWPFWSPLKQVRKGDIVVHLRGKTHQAAFRGYSLADADGFETQQRPPQPGEWSFASSFNRVPLTGYVPFTQPLLLDDVFRDCDRKLRTLFALNRAKPQSSKERLFLVVQAKRLQCLNGAYLSEMSDALAGIIFGPDFSGQPNTRRPARVSASTGHQIVQISARLGQARFSENVRDNYDYRCCFPDCSATYRRFLIGAHIARWNDAPELRGQTANGLCLCLFHDKAFEFGYSRSPPVSASRSVAPQGRTVRGHRRWWRPSLGDPFGRAS